MTIGIIEDDTLLHQALKTALQNAGYQTVSAYTKQEALTAVTGSESLLLIMGFSLLSPSEFFDDPKNGDGRNNKPPAMRVVYCYTKKLPFDLQ